MKIELPTKYDNLTPVNRKLVREKYIELQKNKCWYCDKALDKDPPEDVLEKAIDLRLFPKGFLTHPVHLQHDHETGLTEGAVHARCNAVLWQYYDR